MQCPEISNQPPIMNISVNAELYTCVVICEHADRHHCVKSGNRPKTEVDHIHLNFVTVL